MFKYLLVIFVAIFFNACGSSSSGGNNQSSSPEKTNANPSSTNPSNTNTNTITLNNKTYKTVVSPHTNEIWLDRNLGATKICTATDDTECFGDYYQWGRKKDGHEQRTSSTQTAQVTDINNSGSSFVLDDGTYEDWAKSADINGTARAANWSKIDGTSICPVGFRVPTISEVNNETGSVNNYSDAFSNFLKLPSSGERKASDGKVWNSTRGTIWTVTTYGTQQSSYHYSTYLAAESLKKRSYGFPVRCIKESIAPVASSKTVTFEQASSNNSIIISAIDNDGKTLTYTIVSQPTKGTLSGTAPNLTYTPTNTFSGIDSFTFKANNGSKDSATVTVKIIVQATTNNAFTFQGKTYGTVTSPYGGGRIWLDRNLGANRICVEYKDSECYGDYYQWGRKTDGHEKSNSQVTSTQATNINSAGTKFIYLSSAFENDWVPQNTDNTGSSRQTNWAKTDGSFICPTNFRVPTEAELKAETIDESVTNRDKAFENFLRLPTAGIRSNGTVSYQANYTMVWTNSVIGSAYDSRLLYFISNSATMSSGDREYGHSVRCIKN